MKTALKIIAIIVLSPIYLSVFILTGGRVDLLEMLGLWPA